MTTFPFCYYKEQQRKVREKDCNLILSHLLMEIGGAFPGIVLLFGAEEGRTGKGRSKIRLSSDSATSFKVR